jgi:hypothetical protein
MDETGLSAGSGSGGEASGSAAGGTSGEVTPDEETSPVSPEEEAELVRQLDPLAVNERGDGQGNFSAGLPHPDLAALSAADVALVDAPAPTDPTEGEVHEVPPEELKALADEADFSPEVVDLKGFDEDEDELT